MHSMDMVNNEMLNDDASDRGASSAMADETIDTGRASS
jgi:hypothetical protein